MNFRTLSVLVLATSFAVLTTGCLEEIKDKIETGTILDTLDTEFKSSCLVDSEAITGANRVVLRLKIRTNGNFDYYETWYSGGSCSPANLEVMYSTFGTYSLSGATGSSASIDYVATSGNIMANSVTVQGQFNTACGSTSPYHNNAVTGNNGVHKSYYGVVSCSSKTFPNSANKNFKNLLSYNGGSLNMGTPDDVAPGASGARPTSATIVLTQ